jgi:hypothetical protein
MGKPPDRSGVAEAGRRRPDYVIELVVNPELRARARRAGARVQSFQARHGKAAAPDPDPRQADREAEP